MEMGKPEVPEISSSIYWTHELGEAYLHHLNNFSIEFSSASDSRGVCSFRSADTAACRLGTVLARSEFFNRCIEPLHLRP
jgi:hypothetical protein